MRMLVLPAALLLGAALYTLLPQAESWLAAGLRALLSKTRRLFTTKKGATDERSSLIVYFLALASAATLLCALHPLAAAIVTVPLFTGFSPLPAAVNAKHELDSGKYSKDIPEYERRVLAACLPLGEAFALQIAAPMLLCTIGTPLYLGCALGWVYAGLRAVQEDVPEARRILTPLERMGDGTIAFLLHLCAGLFGRNPLHIGGRNAKEKLMRILSLEGEIDHAPISGDITQALFLCCLCAALLCGMLTMTGMLFS